MCIHEGVFHLRLSGYITGRLILLKKTSHRLTSVEDTESMTYDDEGRLFTRTDGYGNSSTIIYDEVTGYVKEVEGTEGNSLSVDYDETGNVKSISDNSIDADTTGSSVSAGDAQYEYYNDGSLNGEMTMNMIDFFFEEYNDDDWKDFVNCFNYADISIKGVPQDIINVIYSLIGENGEDWLNTPLHKFDGKTALDLLLSEKGEKALKAFIMRMPN